MNYAKILKTSTVAVILLMLTACGNGTDLIGSWVQPVPGLSDIQQGFTLEANGKASSINMSTLQYESWERQNDLLILSGKSIGNHQTIPFQDTLVIERLTKDSLTVRKETLILSYTREK